MKMRMILSTTESRMDGMREREWGVYRGCASVEIGRDGQGREAKRRLSLSISYVLCVTRGRR